MTITATRWHEICCGHRVYGHESKCAHLHGHNYQFEFTITGGLDHLGRVLDFSVIKSTLCEWLEQNWDHRFLVWEGDPAKGALSMLDRAVVVVPFNPTAENMAEHLLRVIAPAVLADTGTLCTRVVIHETAKCSATAEL